MCDPTLCISFVCSTFYISLFTTLCISLFSELRDMCDSTFCGSFLYSTFHVSFTLLVEILVMTCDN